MWYTPGGKREQGETDKEALTREIKEELCVELLPETIQYYGAFEAQAHGKSEGTKVRNTCYTAKFRGEMRPGGEIEKIAWISFSDKEQCSLTQQLIMDDLKKNNLIE